MVIKKPSQVNAEPIKIGFIAPLTGDAGSYGVNAKAAAELAVEEINSMGGINGRTIQLIAEDGKCTGKDASSAANKLINIDKVTAIVGGFCSGETMAFTDLAEQTKTIVISEASSNPAITNAGDYIFRDYASDTAQGKAAAEFIYNKLGKKKVAVLYVNIDWGKGVKDVFISEYKKLGGEIVIEESYTQGSRDMRSQLAKVKQSNPDVLYFLSFTDDAVIGLKQAKTLGLNLPIVGGDAFDGPQFYSDPIADGIMYVASLVPSNEAFEAKMATKTGSDVINAGAPQAYDAVKILGDVMRKVGTNTELIKNALYEVKDYQGVSGTIGFDSNGDLATPNLIIKLIKDGKAEQLK